MANHSNRTSTTLRPQTNDTVGDVDEAEYYLFVMQIVCYCVISVVGSLANVVICVGLSRGRLKSSEYFILNLASADLLVCAVGIPLDIYLHYVDSWPYGSFFCHVIYPSQTLLILISILTLMGMSLERHRAICSPLKQRLSSKWIRVSIVFIWLIAIAAVVPYAKALKFSDLHCIENWSVPDNAKYYTLALFVIDYCIPLTIITYCYTRAGYVLHTKFKKFSRKESTSVKQNIATMKRLQQNKKVIKIFSSAVILFVICVLPGDCYWMWLSFRGYDNHRYDNHLQAFSTIMLYANSAINPFIFGACQMVCHRKLQSRFSDQLTSSSGLSRSKGSGSSTGTPECMNRNSFSRTAVRKQVKYTSLDTKNDHHNKTGDARQYLDNTMQGERDTKLIYRNTSNGLRDTKRDFRDTNQEKRDTNQDKRDTNQEISDATVSKNRSNETLHDARSISSDSCATLHREGEDDAFSMTCDVNETIHNTNCEHDSTNCQCYNTNDDLEENLQHEFQEIPDKTNGFEPNTVESTQWQGHEINECTKNDVGNTADELQGTQTAQRTFPDESDTKEDTSSDLSGSTEFELIKIQSNLLEFIQSNSARETDL